MPYAPSLTAILDREPRPAAGLTSDEVDYAVGDTTCRGYLSRPADDERHPGVLVLHDWLGVGDYVRMRADMLARLGYAAFAADLYGVDVRPSPEEAPGVAAGYYRDQELFRRRIVGGYQAMLAQTGVDQTKTAAIGYCFGGSAALQLARTGADVGGVVSFHGALRSGPEGEAAAISARVLILHGAIDPVVGDEDVLAVENEFRAVAHLDWTLTTYASSMHAFTLPEANDPEHGAQFNPTAERRSWLAVKNFLTELFS